MKTEKNNDAIQMKAGFGISGVTEHELNAVKAFAEVDDAFLSSVDDIASQTGLSRAKIIKHIAIRRLALFGGMYGLAAINDVVDDVKQLMTDTYRESAGEA